MRVEYKSINVYEHELTDTANTLNEDGWLLASMVITNRADVLSDDTYLCMFARPLAESNNG